MPNEIGKIEPKRFEEIMFSFIQRGFEEMPANTFFEALALLDEKERQLPLLIHRIRRGL